MIFLTKNRLSFQSRYDYLIGVKGIVRELHKGSYQLSSIHHLKPKHVTYLINEWQRNNLSNATIKNRMSFIRYVFKAIGQPFALPGANRDFNIGSRAYVSLESKAIHDIDVTKIDDPLLQYSVRLQQQFGLRREESIKFIPSYADQGPYIILKDSWTKGGVSRIIPVNNAEQRALLDELKAKIPRGHSLIPKDKNYAYQKRTYDHAVQKAGFSNLHGLRHAYAQRRYFEITNNLNQGKGWQAPFNGGKRVKELSPKERAIDHQARLIISKELSHSRKQVVRSYCGR